MGRLTDRTFHAADRLPFSAIPSQRGVLPRAGDNLCRPPRRRFDLHVSPFVGHSAARAHRGRAGGGDGGEIGGVGSGGGDDASWRVPPVHAGNALEGSGSPNRADLPIPWRTELEAALPRMVADARREVFGDVAQPPLALFATVMLQRAHPGVERFRLGVHYEGRYREGFAADALSVSDALYGELERTRDCAEGLLVEALLAMWRALRDDVLGDLPAFAQEKATLADVVRAYGKAFVQSRVLRPEQRAALRDIGNVDVVNDSLLPGIPITGQMLLMK